jgi:cysteinyl-tRNA synthetase
MHNGFVRVDDEKMSKSLGNFFTIREVLKQYDPEVVRFFILRAHYRSPLNYSDRISTMPAARLTRLYTALKGIAPEKARSTGKSRTRRRFREAMDDDFNTPEAIAVLFELANEVNRTRSPARRPSQGAGRPAGPARARSGDLPQAAPAASEGLTDAAAIEAASPRASQRRRPRISPTADRIRAELLADGRRAGRQAGRRHRMAARLSFVISAGTVRSC